jgi:trimethylamine--corrinoid protein Co-methyltransferase
MQPFEVLSPTEVAAIHQASLKILSHTGVILHHPAARLQLQEGGAQVAGNRVRLPAHLVEWALAQTPQQVSLRGRGGQTTVLGDGALHWHNLGGAAQIYDPLERTVRPALVKDLIAATRLLDALPGVNSITPFFTPQDAQVMTLAMYRHTLPHTGKPIHGPGAQTAAEVRLLVAMAAVVGHPPEILSMGISPVSPLYFPDDVVEALIASAQAGLPTGPLPCPTAGMTAPLSLSGAIAQQNAEVLAAIVLLELTRPGLPIYYCGRLAMMEPRSGVSVWGGVELGLASAGTVQIAHHYHLPVNVYGLSTNALEMGLQNGYERALNAILPALAGADELSGIGELSAGVTGALAQMVVDDELTSVIGRARRGFHADADALAVELVAEIMDGSRNYLDQAHTVRYLRAGELLVTRLAERGNWDEWDRRGRLDMVLRAQQRVDKLLSEADPLPLEAAQERELDCILNHAIQVLPTV